MKTPKKDWIIVIGGTEVDDVLVYKFTGTDYQVRRKLLQMVLNDMENDKEAWDYGTDKLEEIVVQNDGRVYAYGVYYDYHIDYAATPFDQLMTA